MSPSERLKGIAPFVYAANCGSFTLAAERLSLTSSAVSKSVARLESRLGVILFDRTTRRLALTDAGHAFYATCSRVMTDLAEAEAVLAAQKTDPAGRLRLALPASFGRIRVMPILLGFAEKFPGVLPHISFSDRFVDLIDEGIDLAVRIGGSRDWPASLGHRYLGSERLIFCASPAYLERRGRPENIQDLDRHDCICYGKADGAVSPWLFASHDGDVEQHVVAHRMVAGDGEAQLAAVRAGLGVAQFATWLVQDDLNSGALLEIMAPLATDGLPLHLVWPRARQLTPKVNVLLQELENRLLVR
ncbi:LysR family transcriptional regulator [Undibacterium sp.]|uniref:LysR family transcriptional regulator n=1 Tax=Undibacterium sp. TaxID=1914977 RepID=UPI00374D788D